MIIFKKNPSLRSFLSLSLSFKQNFTAYAVVLAFCLSFPYCSTAVEINKDLGNSTTSPSSESTVSLQIQDPQNKSEGKADSPSTQVISETIVTKPLPKPDLLSTVKTVTAVSPSNNPKTATSASTNYNPEQRAAAREEAITH